MIFKSAKIFKIYEDLSNTRDIVYIGSTCYTLKKCMSNFKIKSKSRVNWANDKFYMMIIIIRMYVCVCVCVCVYIYNTYIYIYV